MKQLSKTVAASTTAVIFTLAIAAMPAAQAGSNIEYYVGAPVGIMAWGFKTLEQCQASASGIGGTCSIDSSVTTPAGAYAYAPRGVRHLRK